MVQQSEYLKLRKFDPVGTDTLVGVCVCVGGLNARGVYFYTIFGKLEFNVNTCPQGIFTKLVSALEPIHRAGLALILNRKSVVLQRRA